MPENSNGALAPMVRKLNLWGRLWPDDIQKILALPHQVRRFDTGQYLVREGDKPEYCCLLLSGYGYRHKMAGNGGRQIVSIHMTGDVVDLQNSLLETADHNVQMLTDGDVAMIPINAIRQL